MRVLTVNTAKIVTLGMMGWGYGLLASGLWLDNDPRVWWAAPLGLLILGLVFWRLRIPRKGEPAEYLLGVLIVMQVTAAIRWWW